MFLGCCANTEFGCCADDLQTALGPYGEGCSCEQTSYGCCPDGQSPAQGPNHEGCGCHFSSYGCCPDSMTEAQGANFTGCPCITFPYGCCPDGITVAEGGNLEGCLSNCSSQFGCCSDGITPKVRNSFPVWNQSSSLNSSRWLTWLTTVHVKQSDLVAAWMGWMQRTDLYLKDVTMFRNPSVICLLKEDLVPITQTK